MSQTHQGKTFEQLLEMVMRVEKMNEECETCSSERTITQHGMDSDRCEVVPCPDCRPRRKQ